jgi:hypothetical protein
MTVCLNTGVLIQIFGRKQPFRPILHTLLEFTRQFLTD